MKNKACSLFVAGVVIAALALPGVARAQLCGHETVESLSKLYPGKGYSPYAQRSFPNRVFWGDTHLHTAMSLDAGLFGNTLGHEEAYRFALANPDVLKQIPCYCGCGVVGHTSNYDCYVAEINDDGSAILDSHGFG